MCRGEGEMLPTERKNMPSFLKRLIACLCKMSIYIKMLREFSERKSDWHRLCTIPLADHIDPQRSV